jgi:hypothetical protein
MTYSVCVCQSNSVQPDSWAYRVYIRVLEEDASLPAAEKDSIIATSNVALKVCVRERE